MSELAYAAGHVYDTSNLEQLLEMGAAFQKGAAIFGAEVYMAYGYLIDPAVNLDNDTLFAMCFTFIHYKGGVNAANPGKETLNVYFFSIELKKHAPYKEDINFILGNFRDNGLVDFKFYEQLPPKAYTRIKKSETNDELVPMNWNQLQ